MRKSSIFLLALGLSVFVVFSVYTESVTVSYVDGTLEVKTGDGWNEVYIGDSIPTDAVVRLGNDSIAQLEGANVSLTLSRPGSYVLGRLLKEKQEMESWGVASLVGNKISNMLNSQRSRASAVMGVRGAKAEDSTDVEWVEDEDNYLAEGKSFIEKARYDEAIQILQEGLRDADEEMKPQYFYFLGVANMGNGRPYIALKYFNRIKPDPYFEYFDGYVVLKGKLLIESFAFKEAKRLFDLYLREAPEGNAAQSIYFLKGIALKGMGDISAAKVAFERAYTMNPSTGIGKKAKEMLASNL